MFSACHSEVALDPYLERFEKLLSQFINNSLYSLGVFWILVGAMKVGIVNVFALLLQHTLKNVPSVVYPSNGVPNNYAVS